MLKHIKKIVVGMVMMSGAAYGSPVFSDDFSNGIDSSKWSTSTQVNDPSSSQAYVVDGGGCAQVYAYAATAEGIGSYAGLTTVENFSIPTNGLTVTADICFPKYATGRNDWDSNGANRPGLAITNAASGANQIKVFPIWKVNSSGGAMELDSWNEGASPVGTSDWVAAGIWVTFETTLYQDHFIANLYNPGETTPIKSWSGTYDPVNVVKLSLVSPTSVAWPSSSILVDNVSVVPEPVSALLLLTGALMTLRRRK